MDRGRLRLGHVFASLLLLSAMGCARVPKQSEAVKNAKLETSNAELLLRAVELGRDAIRELEIAADSIDVRTTDPQIHRNTLLWRLSVVSATTEAALRGDPVVAMVDLYALRVQVQDFLHSPRGAASLGEGYPIAARAIARVEEHWESSANAIGANFSDQDRATIEQWAHAHPIEGLPFTRASPALELAARLTATQSGIGAAVGGIQSTLERLEYRASLVNEYAIKQAMWLSRYAALELGESPQGSGLTETMDRARGLMIDAPDLVAGERAAILADVERQRLATLGTVADERAILLAAIAAERQVVLAAVSVERQLLVRDVDSMRVRTIEDSFRVVDHLMFRMAQLAAGILLACGLGVWLLFRGRRPFQPARN